MFKMFKKTIDPTPLLTSTLYDEHSFYETISKDIRSSRSSIRIESPYITLRRTNEIAPLLKQSLRKGVSVLVFTRNPYHHDGVLIDEALRGINILRDIGVKVVTCDDMRHRKLAIIDDYILWEGSLNMLSQNGSKEIMRRITSVELCAEMVKFIN